MDLLAIIKDRINAEMTAVGNVSDNNTCHEATDVYQLGRAESTEKTSRTSNADLTPVAIIHPVTPPIRDAWPPEVQSLINWFSTTELPTEPFHFPKVGKVIDPVKYFEQFRIEIEIGPRGPRARMGTLQSDLRKLKDYLE